MVCGSEGKNLCALGCGITCVIVITLSLLLVPVHVADPSLVVDIIEVKIEKLCSLNTPIVRLRDEYKAAKALLQQHVQHVDVGVV